jgi:hypothetical protein
MQGNGFCWIILLYRNPSLTVCEALYHLSIGRSWKMDCS